MWNRALSPPLLFPLLLLGVLLSAGVGLFSENKLLLPLLNVLFSYPFLFGLLAREQRSRAVVAMIFWAICLGTVMVAYNHTELRTVSTIA